MAAGFPRWLKWALAFIVGSGVALVAAVLLLVGPYAKEQVLKDARARGIDLKPGDISLGFFRVTVGPSTFGLIGVRGLQGKVARTEVQLSGFTPVRVEATDLQLSLTGSAAILALDLTRWTQRFPRAYELPAQAKPVTVTWRGAAGKPPWLEVHGGTLIPSGDRSATFKASDAKLAGVSLGEIGAAWNSKQAEVSLGFGVPAVDGAPVRVRVHHEQQPPTAEIQLVSTQLSRLLQPLGMEAPPDLIDSDKTQVEGQANLTFTAAGPVTGELKLKLTGWVPPHPRELDGFVFGNVTTYVTDFEVDQAYTVATLTNSKLEAGAFRLGGEGSIKREQDHARILLNMKGNLACDALAGAAAQTHLGQALGGLIGAAARAALKGSVAVVVSIDADTRKLQEAKLLRTIGVGCGLKPLKLPTPEELLKLPAEFTKNLPALPKELPEGLKQGLPGSLPSLPSALPGLPQVEVKTEPAKPAPASSK